ncbi:MAG TPA: HPF/RaiA family ribosome-associated protein [Gammaproteobacteria bacterium]|nr:HPF/RaiA family ribosome-associated protein [Gammaproteobacteria bacterium]
MIKVTGRNTPSLGRNRARKPDSLKRAPMPAHIRTTGVEIDQADRDYIRRKLGRKLGKFGSDIERISVRIEDVNGPRGGHDKRCRIKIVLRGLPSIVVEQQHAALQAAIDGALSRIGRPVKRRLQRRRVKTRGRGARKP